MKKFCNVGGDNIWVGTKKDLSEMKEEMNFKPSEHKDIIRKLNNIIQELE